MNYLFLSVKNGNTLGSNIELDPIKFNFMDKKQQETFCKILCSTQRQSYRFETTRGRVIDDRSFIFR